MWKDYKIGIIITLVLLIAGTTYYFTAGLGEGMDGPSPEAAAVLRDAQVKTVFADGKAVKLFATTSEASLAKLPAAEGKNLPQGSLVIGNAEAGMMREEKLFANVGDALNGLFGIDTKVGGVLAPTGMVIDDMHFVDAQQYAQLNGEEGRVFAKFTPDGAPKMFLTLSEDAQAPVPLALAEGDMADYKSATLAGVTYKPVIVGSKEAAMMREENLFQRPGDTIRGFFGNDIVIVGVLAETNSSLDMMHITPMGASDLA